MIGEWTPEMSAHLQELQKRELQFFERHGVDYALVDDKTGKATPAWRAWVLAVEHEYGLQDGEGRVWLDTPLGRKSFILGYLRGKDEDV